MNASQMASSNNLSTKEDTACSSSSIQLSNKSIRLDGAVQLYQTLQASKAPVSLTLERCDISEFHFVQSPNLQHLTISGRAKHLSRLVQALGQSCLQSFHLWQVPLHDLELRYLLQALCSIATLTSIRLSLCELGPQHAFNLYHPEGKWPPNLQHLDLSHNHLEDSNLLLLLEDPTRDFPQLTLNLSHNRLGSNVFSSRLHYAHLYLQELDLSHNQIGPYGLENLALSMQVNGGKSVLKILKMNSCWLGHEGARCLARIVQHSTSLQELQVDFNVLGDVGVSRLVLDGLAMAPHGGRLTHLSLASNNMGLDGAVAVATVLRHGRLQELNVSYNNRVPSQGWEALHRAVQTNTKLQHVRTKGIWNEPFASMIQLELEILRTDKFAKLLEQDNSLVWPLLLEAAFVQEWGVGLVYELLREKPTIVVGT
jgi:hypothetical protein